MKQLSTMSSRASSSSRRFVVPGATTTADRKHLSWRVLFRREFLGSPDHVNGSCRDLRHAASSAASGSVMMSTCSRKINTTTAITPTKKSFSTTTSRRSFSSLSWHDEIGSLSLSERQEGFLLSKLPTHITEQDLYQLLRGEGVTLDDIFLARSRLGRSTGRAVVRCEENIPHVAKMLSSVWFDDRNASGSSGPPEGHLQTPALAQPPEVSYRPLDRHDIRLFIEQAEAHLRYSDDLHFLARPEHLLRTVTLHNVPRAYGRQDVAAVLLQHCSVQIPPEHIVFQMKKHGIQGDMCFVVCDSEKQAKHVMAAVQELAVPKHAKYETLFGCSFLYADRSCLFWNNDGSEQLDFEQENRYQVYTQGWDKDLSVEEFTSFLNHLKFFPERVRKLHSVLPLAGGEERLARRQNMTDSEDHHVGHAADHLHSENKQRPLGSCAQDQALDAESSSLSPHVDVAEELFPAFSSGLTMKDFKNDQINKKRAPGAQKFLPSSGFILEFSNMKLTKACFTRLRRMKRRWQMPASTLLYAYPRTVDVHWAHEKVFADEKEQDVELVEPVVY
ncbi:unnamed protein product [Amoebophrya sp. A120]|nr:unnamed protein product [Amoebophrya sp. A120]|eukprot:GSA120T00007973001.1